jgi:hypothetical protein
MSSRTAIVKKTLAARQGMMKVRIFEDALQDLNEGFAF